MSSLVLMISFVFSNVRCEVWDFIESGILSWRHSHWWSVKCWSNFDWWRMHRNRFECNWRIVMGLSALDSKGENLNNEYMELGAVEACKCSPLYSYPEERTIFLALKKRNDFFHFVGRLQMHFWRNGYQASTHCRRCARQRVPMSRRLPKLSALIRASVQNSCKLPSVLVAVAFKRIFLI